MRFLDSARSIGKKLKKLIMTVVNCSNEHGCQADFKAGQHIKV